MSSRSITFTKDFANRAKGDVWEDCPNMLASDLVRIDNVAKYNDIEEEKPAKKSKKESKDSE